MRCLHRLQTERWWRWANRQHDCWQGGEAAPPPLCPECGTRWTLVTDDSGHSNYLSDRTYPPLRTERGTTSTPARP